MNPTFIVLFVCIIFSEIGTYARQAVQWKRDGKWPGSEDWEVSVVVETFIGAVIGLLVWLISLLAGEPTYWLQALLYLNAIALGYAGVDALEGLLKRYEPVPDPPSG